MIYNIQCAICLKNTTQTLVVTDAKISLYFKKPNQTWDESLCFYHKWNTDIGYIPAGENESTGENVTVAIKIDIGQKVRNSGRSRSDLKNN